LLYQLDQHSVDKMLNVRCTEIDAKGVWYDTQTANNNYCEADTVIIAAGMKALAEEARAYMQAAPEVRIIGDCYKAGNIRNATTQGYDAGKSI